MNVCVYCGSSPVCDPVYRDAAFAFGTLMAKERVHVIYGGGRKGLMGAVADAVLEKNGRITGIIPEFMVNNGWGNNDLTEQVIVPTMHTRKKMMMDSADLMIALPGGIGTLEELIEAITWRQLGLHDKPVLILNTNGFYKPFIEHLGRCVDERFLDTKRKELWNVVDTPVQAAEFITGMRMQAG